MTKKEKKGGIKEGTKQEAQVRVLLPERQSRFSIGGRVHYACRATLCPVVNNSCTKDYGKI